MLTCFLLLLCIFAFCTRFFPNATKSDKKFSIFAFFLMFSITMLIPITAILDEEDTINDRNELCYRLENEDINIELVEDCIEFNDRLEFRKNTANNIVLGFSRLGISTFKEIDPIDLDEYINIVDKK